MTDTELLNGYIQKSGFKKTYIAKVAGIPQGSFSKKIKNKRKFTPDEIVALCKILGIKTLRDRDAVFFCRKSSHSGYRLKGSENMKEELIRIIQNMDEYRIRLVLSFVKRLCGR